MSAGTRRVLRRRSFMRAAGLGLAGAMLAACGGGQTATQPAAAPAKEAPKEAPKAAAPQAPSSGRAKITFSAVGDAKLEVPVFEAIAQSFNKSQEKLEVEVQPFPQGGYAKAIAMLEAKDTPDILRIADDDSYYIGASGNIVELTDFYKTDLKTDEYFPFFFQEIHNEGKIFAFNACLVPALCFYNEDHFKEAGITAPTKWSDAWDFDTFLANARKLTKKNGDFVERYAFTGQNWAEWGPYAAGAGEYNHNQTKSLLDSEAYIEHLKAFQSLWTEKLMVPSAENVVELFSSGQLAIMGYVASYAAILPPELNWKWMPYPKFKAHGYGSSYSRTLAISKHGPGKSPENAWQYLKFMLSEESQKIIAHQPWGNPPSVKVGLSDYYLKDERWANKNANLLIEAMDFTYPRPMNPMHYTAHTKFGGDTRWKEIETGTQDVAAFAKDMAKLHNDEIAKAKWEFVPPQTWGKDGGQSVYHRWFYKGERQADDPRVVK